jgi:hypothetical protein
MGLQVALKNPLTCPPGARLSSPEGRGMSWLTCLANVSASDTPRLSSPKAKGEERNGITYGDTVKRRGSHTFFSLWEKYPSAAKGDEGLMGLPVGFKEALTCLAGDRLSSPEGRGMSWLTCLG